LITRDNDDKEFSLEPSKKLAETIYELHPELRHKHAVDITIKFEKC